MYMPYTTNPHLPRLRMEAAKLVLQKGWSTRKVARHTGFHQSTIVRWVEKARHTNRNTILTENCRPYHHPKQLSDELVAKIIDYRQKYRRCAKVLHYLLSKDGYLISLSSIERVLRRFQMVNHSKWKKWHQYPPRPVAEKPGILVQIDSMHDGPVQDRLSAYALIDVFSRWGYAEVSERINNYRSAEFIARARTIAPFMFSTLQSDHGTEFSKWFTKTIEHEGIFHRHSRVRTPTDNSRVERFIQTLQRECLNRIPKTSKSWQKEIPDYLRYYNNERPHMALGMKTPQEWLQAID